MEELIIKTFIYSILKPALEAITEQNFAERGITAKVEMSLDIKHVDISKFMQNVDAAQKPASAFDMGSVIIRAFRNDEDKE